LLRLLLLTRSIIVASEDWCSHRFHWRVPIRALRHYWCGCRAGLKSAPTVSRFVRVSASAFAAAADGGAACRGGFQTRPVPQQALVPQEAANAHEKTRRGIRPG